MSTFSYSAETPANILFYGGSILTMNDTQPLAEAMAYDINGTIIAVGNTEAVCALP